MVDQEHSFGRRWEQIGTEDIEIEVTIDMADLLTARGIVAARREGGITTACNGSIVFRRTPTPPVFKPLGPNEGMQA